MTYRHISYSEAKVLEGKHAKYCSISPTTIYIGAIDNGKVIGAVGYKKMKGGIIELCSDIVLPDYRKRGIYTTLCGLRDAEISHIEHNREIAYCTGYSLGRYLANGFRKVREYTISTKVERII